MINKEEFDIIKKELKVLDEEDKDLCGDFLKGISEVLDKIKGGLTTEQLTTKENALLLHFHRRVLRNIEYQLQELTLEDKLNSLIPNLLTQGFIPLAISFDIHKNFEGVALGISTLSKAAIKEEAITELQGRMEEAING